MNLQQARRILEITPEDDKTAIKKKYRRLMGQFHPDAQIADNADAGASDSIRKAQEINEAYEYLKKHTIVFQRTDTKKKGTGRQQAGKNRDGAESIWKDRTPKKPQWTGKCNEKAFCERNVYLRYSMDVAENTDKLYYQVARGCFLWNPETEDFTLFVTSLHHATKELLEQVEEKAADVKCNTGRNEGKGGTDARRTTAGKAGGEATGYAATDRFVVQSKLFYHLSAQFTDPVMILPKIAKPEKTDETGREIYHFHTSLGADATQSVYRQLTALQSGDAIYPLTFRENKIIVCRQKQYPLGHLSFEDDRLYFSLIPLLQEKLAQVQMKVRKVQIFRKSHPYKVKVDIDLYFRTEKNWKEYKGRDRNLEIMEILREYEDSLQN